jgi:hypothetical protein
MKGKSNQDDGAFPEPKEMSGWLEREIADIHKAGELRIKDAARFVTAYSRGDLSKEEAEEASFKYAQRWGDVFPGIMRSEGLNDDEIVRKMDEARVKQGVLKHRLRDTKNSGRSDF